jgi:hypothetical protein
VQRKCAGKGSGNRNAAMLKKENRITFFTSAAFQYFFEKQEALKLEM